MKIQTQNSASARMNEHPLAATAVCATAQQMIKNLLTLGGETRGNRRHVHEGKGEHTGQGAGESILTNDEDVPTQIA